ncbi:LPXTG-motif cell wall anchor domain-containing protein [Thermoactinomyces sp. DSM 45891]|uniref:LPXTG cell wall anchor domain-containing protein n=1 Tax=Thermoactinomyces sp. DSM 45891 TaxID=1761907 RepID=UPI00091EA91E|nr:LPXTG cell wall anchor domain-containing protein [Thermoactinomyces sp. DSM 45891]SFX22492.1 LPXTG-motif cell wall anchor domain-containing protein [Thermoactinomyces sp. DSM 45891]
MARMTKPYAVLATLALSVTAFQGVVAAEEPKAPITPATEQKTTAPEVKVEVKAEDTKSTEAEKQAEVKPEDKKATETGNKTDEKTTEKADSTAGGKTDGKPGETSPNTNPSTPGTSKPVDKKEDEAKGPSLHAKASFKNGTLTVIASVANAKHIKGLWYADGYKPGSEKVEFTSEKQSKNGFTQTFTFKNVKPGVYHVAVGFIGTIDDLEVGNDEDFVVLKIDTRKGGATKPVENKTTVKASAKKEATAEKATTDKKEAKKTTTNGQGGTLPKTATNYPIATVAGAAVLMAGAGLFLVARRRKQNQS